MNKPEVTRQGFLNMQVCVPNDYTDEQATAFAEAENPCGTVNGWIMRHEGHEMLCGSPSRMPCQREEREGCVHIMFDA